MTIAIRLFPLLVLLLVGGCGGNEPTTTTITIRDVERASGGEGPTFQDLDGNPLELGDFEGSRVFLNYWATWCAPCIREIPSIARAAEKLAEENYVFLLASDESAMRIREFVEEHGFEGNFVKLNGFFSEQGVKAVPSSRLYDAEGNLVGAWVGPYEWDSRQMLSELRNARASLKQ